MMRRILLMGRRGCGKTSLILRIHGEADSAKKTQAAVYHIDFIDVPGEYLEVRSFYRALIMLSSEACGIALLQAADDRQSLYPGGLARTFSKPVIGVVTKTDVAGADLKRAESILREAGARQVLYTSSVTDEGIDELKYCLNDLRNPGDGI